MHKRTRGKLGFYRYDQRGFACLIVETRGVPLFGETGTTSGDGSIEKKQTPRQQSINITLQCTFMNETWHGTDGIYVQFAISLIEVDLKRNSNSNSKCGSN